MPAIRDSEWLQALREKLLADLQNNVSGITQRAYDKRMSEGDTGIKLLTTHLDYPRLLEIGFVVESSYGDNRQVSTQGSWMGGHDSHYTVYIQFRKLSNVMTPDFKTQPKSIQKKQLQDVFDKCDVQVNCDCPAYHWQGSHEDNTKAHTTILKYGGPKGKGIWRARHKASGGLSEPYIRVCKHVLQCSEEIDSFINDMIAQLTKGVVSKVSKTKKGAEKETVNPEKKPGEAEAKEVRAQKTSKEDVQPEDAVDVMEAAEGDQKDDALEENGQVLNEAQLRELFGKKKLTGDPGFEAKHKYRSKDEEMMFGQKVKDDVSRAVNEHSILANPAIYLRRTGQVLDGVIINEPYKKVIEYYTQNYSEMETSWKKIEELVDTYDLELSKSLTLGEAGEYAPGMWCPNEYLKNGPWFVIRLSGDYESEATAMLLELRERFLGKNMKKTTYDKLKDVMTSTLTLFNMYEAPMVADNLFDTIDDVNEIERTMLKDED